MNVELHWCTGAGHGQVVTKCPSDFARWLNTFFGRTLASPAA